MNKRYIFLAFALVLISIPVYLIFKSESVLASGHLHKIQLEAYDPLDPFRGKYLQLNYNNWVPCDPTLKKGDPVYITLKKDSLGFSQFDYGSATTPETDDYFETTVTHYFEKIAEFQPKNIGRYFINEDKAKAAEDVLQNHARNRPEELYIAVRVLDGEIQLEDIYVEEKRLLEYLSDHNL